MQCVTNHVKQSMKCSQCNEAVPEDSPQYLECCQTLNMLFPEHLDLGATEPEAEVAGVNQTITVVMLGGQSTVISYSPSMLIQKLKTTVQSRLGPHPDKQRLLYKEQELKV